MKTGVFNAWVFIVFCILVTPFSPVIVIDYCMRLCKQCVLLCYILVTVNVINTNLFYYTIE